MSTATAEVQKLFDKMFDAKVFKRVWSDMSLLVGNYDREDIDGGAFVMAFFAYAINLLQENGVSNKDVRTALELCFEHATISSGKIEWGKVIEGD